MQDVSAVDPPVFSSLVPEVEWIAQTVRDLAPRRDPLEILEAGCGRAWALQLGGRPYRLTGVDLSEDALQHRSTVVRDLDVAVCGDLASVELAIASFDVIYSAYVLEHVVDARNILENFDRWLRPGGLVVLRLPDRQTVVGLLARITPYRTHVWYYRYVLRHRLAGVDGRPPFPTVYEPIMSRPQLRQFFAARGYEIIGERLTRPFPGEEGRAWRVARKLVTLIGMLSFGKLDGRHNNFGLIVRKPAGPA